MPQEDRQNLSELTLRAEQGDVHAQSKLALYYVSDDCVEKDYNKAAYWFTKAAAQNDPLAMVNLGRMYAAGVGVEKNLSTSIDLLVGTIGRGVSRASEIILDTLEFADITLLAEQGNARAQLFLGMCFVDGEGANKDIPRAMYWYQKAAEQNEPLALLICGIRLSEGKGVKKDLLSSAEKLTKAIELGVLKAADYLGTVWDQINVEVPFYLVKITERKWAEKLLDGHVFMRSLACFGDLTRRDATTNNTFRGDTMEGFSESFGDGHNPYGYITNSDGSIEEIIPGQIGVIDVLLLREKIFCLYALEYDNENKRFIQPDARLQDFGDTAIVILDCKQFLFRLCNAFVQRYGNAFWTSFKRVSYNIDLTQKKYYSEFSKSLSYAWQKEFRVALDLTEGRFDKKTLDDATDYAKMTFPGVLEEDTNPDSIADALTIQIGDISDICIQMPTSDFINQKGIEAITQSRFFPPSKLDPLEVPRKRRPTFFKIIAHLPLKNSEANE